VFSSAVNKDQVQKNQRISRSVANETGSTIIETRIGPDRYFIAPI